MLKTAGSQPTGGAKFPTIHSAQTGLARCRRTEARTGGVHFTPTGASWINQVELATEFGTNDEEMIGLSWAQRRLLLTTARTKKSADFIAHLEGARPPLRPQAGAARDARRARPRQRPDPYQQGDAGRLGRPQPLTHGRMAAEMPPNSMTSSPSGATSRRIISRTFTNADHLDHAIHRVTACALRRLREGVHGCLLAVVGALPAQRLLGADDLRSPRCACAWLRPCGGDRLRDGDHRASPRSYEREDFVFETLHYLALLKQKINALDQAAPLAGWQLPEVSGEVLSCLHGRVTGGEVGSAQLGLLFAYFTTGYQRTNVRY